MDVDGDLWISCFTIHELLVGYNKCSFYWGFYIAVGCLVQWMLMTVILLMHGHSAGCCSLWQQGVLQRPLWTTVSSKNKFNKAIYKLCSFYKAHSPASLLHASYDQAWKLESLPPSIFCKQPVYTNVSPCIFTVDAHALVAFLNVTHNCYPLYNRCTYSGLSFLTVPSSFKLT